MLVSEILRIKGNALFTSSPNGTVLDAVKVMAQHDILESDPSPDRRERQCDDHHQPERTARERKVRRADQHRRGQHAGGEVGQRHEPPALGAGLAIHVQYNPNSSTSWFASIMGIISNVTMLAIILAGAAIIREREHGTMDHLLAMPLFAFERAEGKLCA